MTDAWMMFLIGQAVVIVLSIVGSHLKTKVAIAELSALLEVKFKSMHDDVEQLKVDHRKLRDKVDGISRHVAVIEGMEMGRPHSKCPFAEATVKENR